MAKLRNLLNASQYASLEPEASSFRIDIPHSRTAFLLLHGFTGMPRELRGISECLASMGYSSYAPRYPGHGTTRSDFLATGSRDWMRRALDAYLELASEYEFVHILGHSMGGLIGASLAAVFKPGNLVLLAPAFQIKRWILRFTPYIAPFMWVVKKNRPLPESETDPLRRKLYADYWSDDLVSGAAHLEKLRRTAVALLSDVESRVLVIIGSEDAAVEPSVGEYLRTRMIHAASFESKILEGAGHLFPFDKDMEKAASVLTEWLNNTSQADVI